MRDAFIKEIDQRFGSGIFANDLARGLYVASGAPFLIQDAAERIVRAIISNPRLYLRVEKVRQVMQSKRNT